MADEAAPQETVIRSLAGLARELGIAELEVDGVRMVLADQPSQPKPFSAPESDEDFQLRKQASRERRSRMMFRSAGGRIVDISQDK